jgi:hypothetical protein
MNDISFSGTTSDDYTEQPESNRNPHDSKGFSWFLRSAAHTENIPQNNSKNRCRLAHRERGSAGDL